MAVSISLSFVHLKKTDFYWQRIKHLGVKVKETMISCYNKVVKHTLEVSR